MGGLLAYYVLEWGEDGEQALYAQFSPLDANFPPLSLVNYVQLLGVLGKQLSSLDQVNQWLTKPKLVNSLGQLTNFNYGHDYGTLTMGFSAFARLEEPISYIINQNEDDAHQYYLISN